MTCPLCQTDTAEAVREVLWRDDFCRAIWVDDSNYPGFCRVILNAHIKEMSDLSPSDQQRLMTVVFAVESAIKSVAHPDKINLASLGNVVPHLHWHVIPRWKTDINFPDTIWAAPRRSATTRTLPPDFRPQLQAQLKQLLAQPK